MAPDYLSDVWTQTTGSWDSRTVPGQPMLGPELKNPDNVIYRGPLGSTSIVPSNGTGPLDQWTVRASDTTQSLFDIAYGTNTFVAVGDLGTILTSPDGAAWRARDSGTTNRLYAIAYGADTFVAVGDSGTILTSPDGTLWTRLTWDISAPPRSAQQSAILERITYGNHTFVAGGVWNLTEFWLNLTSPDGIHWTDFTSPTFPNGGLNYLTFGNGQFVAMGVQESLLSSPDGITWTLRLKAPGWDYPVTGVTYGNGRFVALMTNPWVSADGITWMEFDPPIGLAVGLAFGKDSFVTINYTGVLNLQTLSSNDGVNWTTHVFPTIPGLQSHGFKIAFGNDTFVIAGPAGTILQSAPLTYVPTLISGRFNHDAFDISLEGTVGQSYIIQSANDLSPTNLWHTVGMLTLTNLSGTWSDSAVKDPSHRFYRAVSQP